MSPHLLIHGRRERKRGFGGQHQCAEQIVRQTVRQTRDAVGARGRNEQQMRAIREFDMTGTPAFLFIEDTAEHRIARERLERERRDEARRARGHRHVHLMAALMRPKAGTRPTAAEVLDMPPSPVAM